MYQHIVDSVNQICVDKLLSFSQLTANFSVLRDIGWEQEVLGFSETNHPIIAFSKGNIHKPLMMAYGFPHPDEPLGANALFAFMLTLKDKHVLFDFFRFSIVLCADPNFAYKNNSWVEKNTFQSFISDNVRPLHVGKEVDYHFPIDYCNLQFSISSPADKYNLDPVLPHSQAIADWIKNGNPSVLGLFHNEHVSGSFTYLSHKPSSSFIQQVDAYHKQIDVPIHWGEKTDPGEYWFRKRKDYLKEFSIEKTVQSLKNKHDDFEDKTWLGCVSVGEFVESLQENITVITPEIGLWHSQHIDNQQVYMKPIEAIWETPSRLVYENKLQHVFMSPQNTQKPVLLTRGMKILEMYEKKKSLRTLQKQLWKKFKESGLYDSQQLQVINYENCLSAVFDKSLVTQAVYASSFQQTITYAQFYDLETRYRCNYCLEMSWGKQLYDNFNFSEGSEGLAQILERETKMVFDQVSPINITSASRSMIFRWLLSANI